MYNAAVVTLPGRRGGAGRASWTERARELSDRRFDPLLSDRDDTIAPAKTTPRMIEPPLGRVRSVVRSPV